MPRSALARCRGLFNAANLYFMGRYRRRQPILEESLAIARGKVDKANIEAALSLLGLASLRDSDITKLYVDILWKRLRGPGNSAISVESPLRPMGLPSFIVL